MNSADYLTRALWQDTKSGRVYQIIAFSTREGNNLTLVSYSEVNKNHPATPLMTSTVSEFFGGRFLRLKPHQAKVWRDRG